MKRLLATDDVCVKQRRSKLLIDLADLQTQTIGSRGKATMKLWAKVRGHQNKAAVLRDLYRTQELLEAFGCKLDFGTTEEDGFSIDVGHASLRAIVTRESSDALAFVEERRKRGQPDALSHDDDTSLSGVCLQCNATLRVPVEELIAKRSSGAEMRQLRKEFHVGHARLGRILRAAGLDRRPGRQPVEALRDRGDVVQAIELARGRAPTNAKAIEISKRLHCSLATAYRFLRRVKGGRVSSDFTERKRS